MTTHARPLHDRFETLARRVPHVPLALLPTPLVTRDGPLGACLCKLDGQTHDLYGGNKVRKLEYVLAQAQRHGAARVATFGAAGSNHATATAVHARALGIGCVSFLSRQRPTRFVAANLKRQLSAGADIVFVSGDRAQREAQARAYVNRLDGRTWRIPMGGSSPAGTLGYVNAGLEL
ncbi:MAG: pyridoxal-phosphate dependent enzyme, partial [Pseudomonadota bacterium]